MCELDFLYANFECDTCDTYLYQVISKFINKWQSYESGTTFYAHFCKSLCDIDLSAADIGLDRGK